MRQKKHKNIKIKFKFMWEHKGTFSSLSLRASRIQLWLFRPLNSRCHLKAAPLIMQHRACRERECINNVFWIIETSQRHFVCFSCTWILTWTLSTRRKPGSGWFFSRKVSPQAFVMFSQVFAGFVKKNNIDSAVFVYKHVLETHSFWINGFTMYCFFYSRRNIVL